MNTLKPNSIFSTKFEETSYLNTAIMFQMTIYNLVAGMQSFNIYDYVHVHFKR